MVQEMRTLESDTLRESFQLWQSEQESLEAEWNESLEALVAFQKHLDHWQNELHQSREQLRQEQADWDQQRAEWKDEQTRLKDKQKEATTEADARLAEGQEKLAQLSQQLLAKTDELRQTDQRRAELTAELELARAQNLSLVEEVSEQKRLLETERAAWVGQMQHMRELLEARAAAPVTGYDDVARANVEPAPPNPLAAPAARPAKSSGDKQSANNPVLGSIVEQFGKLRQQRASDRQTGKKSR